MCISSQARTYVFASEPFMEAKLELDWFDGNILYRIS